MKKIHIVIPDLFLPRQLAAYAGADLVLPALEKILARAQVEPLKVDTLEAWLCQQFGLKGEAIAPITLLAEGVLPDAYYWMRADPVGVSMQRDQMVLRADSLLSEDEARQLCATLNEHFKADGLRFLAPHPQRWYVRLEKEPELHTLALAQVVGGNIHTHLPTGAHALRWHSIFNEIQMLFHEHAVNQAREQRGEHAISGIWFWGGGKLAQVSPQSFAKVAGDSELAQAFAQAAGLSSLRATDNMQLNVDEWQGDLLLVWEGLRGALQHANIAQWRYALQQFEANYAAPLLKALAAGRVEEIKMDVLSEGASHRFVLSRPGLWKVWRSRKPLLHYALSQAED